MKQTILQEMHVMLQLYRDVLLLLCSWDTWRVHHIQGIRAQVVKSGPSKCM